MPLIAFSEAHGAPMQRFYNLLCLAYGADQQTFGDLIDQKHGRVAEATALFQGHLPEARACVGSSLANSTTRFTI